MTKNEIMNYVTETPHNVNRNILGQKLDELQKNVSWNDLKDKPFYTETVEEVVLPRVEVTGRMSTQYEGKDGYIPIPFVSNRHYIVVFDGVEYECVGTTVEYGGVYRVSIGNPKLITVNADDNGMPFAIISYSDADGDWCTSYGTEVDTYHTFEIRQKVETTHTLDPKYLPEPDMVITVSAKFYDKITVDNTTITSGTFAALSEKLWAGTPVDVRIRYVATVGSYEAHATEVKATAIWYAGMILLYWAIPYAAAVVVRQLVVSEGENISNASNSVVSAENQ